MKPPPVSHPLTSLSAYIGLFCALVLAVTCNAFLDIKYGTFGGEVLLWTAVFGLTLRLGWRQQGQLENSGRQGQKILLVLGLFLSVLVFIPTWGSPRAGIAMLAMLQAAQNCATVTRRQLHFGLLVSAVMVMFAAGHYRADWTMLFYLVPYLTAVVFTLVAEQVDLRTRDLSRNSLARSTVGGQWVAILAATSAILLVGAILYSITPQLTRPYLQWRYGQLANLIKVGEKQRLEVGNRPKGNEPGVGQQQTQEEINGNSNRNDSQDSVGQHSRNQADGKSGVSGQNLSSDESMGGSETMLGSRWPSSEEMRQAAKRSGMPNWQRKAINSMANASEWISKTVQPTLQGADELKQSIKNWLQQNRGHVIKTLLVIIVLLLLYALWRLLREAKSGTWLMSHLDYLRFGILKWHTDGPVGARQIYRAMERIFALEDVKRSHHMNSQEYLDQLKQFHRHPHIEAGELTALFENLRYGKAPQDAGQLGRMCEIYRQIYQQTQD